MQPQGRARRLAEAMGEYRESVRANLASATEYLIAGTGGALGAYMLADGERGIGGLALLLSAALAANATRQGLTTLRAYRGATMALREGYGDQLADTLEREAEDSLDEARKAGVVLAMERYGASHRAA